MSNYTKYYTSSNVAVYLESPAAAISSKYPSVLLDTLNSIGWNESLTSAPTYQIGNQLFAFTNEGNVLVTGILELNFTHDDYLRHVISTVFDISVPTQEELINKFLFGTPSEAAGAANVNLSEASTQTLLSGIQSYSEGFNIRVVFNNGSHYHSDEDKSFLIENVKIISASMNPSVSNSGQIIHAFQFIAQQVRS